MSKSVIKSECAWSSAPPIEQLDNGDPRCLAARPLDTLTSPDVCYYRQCNLVREKGNAQFCTAHAKDPDRMLWSEFQKRRPANASLTTLLPITDDPIAAQANLTTWKIREGLAENATLNRAVAELNRFAEEIRQLDEHLANNGKFQARAEGELEEKLKDLEGKLKESQATAKRHAEEVAKADSLVNALKEKKGELEEAQRDKKQVEKEIAETKAALTEALSTNAERKSLLETLDALTKERDSLKQELIEKSRLVQKNAEEVAKGVQARAELKGNDAAQITALNQEIFNTKNQLAETTSSFNQQNNAIQELREDAKRAQTQVAQLQERIGVLNNQLGQQKSDYDNQVQKANELARQNLAYQKEAQLQNEILDQRRAENADLKRELDVRTTSFETLAKLNPPQTPVVPPKASVAPPSTPQPQPQAQPQQILAKPNPPQTPVVPPKASVAPPSTPQPVIAAKTAAALPSVTPAVGASTPAPITSAPPAAEARVVKTQPVTITSAPQAEEKGVSSGQTVFNNDDDDGDEEDDDSQEAKQKRIGDSRIAQAQKEAEDRAETQRLAQAENARKQQELTRIAEAEKEKEAKRVREEAERVYRAEQETKARVLREAQVREAEAKRVRDLEEEQKASPDVEDEQDNEDGEGDENEDESEDENEDGEGDGDGDDDENKFASPSSDRSVEVRSIKNQKNKFASNSPEYKEIQKGWTNKLKGGQFARIGRLVSKDFDGIEKNNMNAKKLYDFVGTRGIPYRIYKSAVEGDKEANKKAKVANKKVKDATPSREPIRRSQRIAAK